MSVTLVYSPGISAPIVMPIDDAFIATSSVLPATWNILTRVSSQSSYSWKITQQQVTATVACAWNTEFRVKSNTLGASQAGLTAPVVHPITWSYSSAQFRWNADKRLFVYFLGNEVVPQDQTSNPGLRFPVDRPLLWSYTTTAKTVVANCSTFVWNITQTKISRKSFGWNVRSLVHTSKQVAFRALQRVYSPGNVPENFYNGIAQAIVHPIDNTNYVGPAKYTWNVNARRYSQETVRYNVLSTRVSQKAFAFKTLCTHVVTQVAATWMLRKSVVSRKASSWAMQLRTYRRLKTAWNVLNPVVSQKAVAFNVRNLVRVLKVPTTNYMLTMPIVHPIDVYQTATIEFQWAVVKRQSSKLKVAYNVALRDPALMKSSWNTLFRVTIPNPDAIYVPGVTQPVVHPITEKRYNWGPRFTWNLGVTHVVTQQQFAYNALNKVVTKKACKWNTSQRYPTYAAVSFNTLMSVVSQDTMDWNVGQALPQYIRQTAMAREDFAY